VCAAQALGESSILGRQLHSGPSILKGARYVAGGPARSRVVWLSASTVISSRAPTARVRSKLTRGQERGWAKEPGRYLFSLVRVRFEHVVHGAQRGKI
jgi:hypothetical protein